MSDNYRDDRDLAFLQFCSESDLRTLAHYLTHDADGLRRVTEDLLSHPDYKRQADAPDGHVRCWKLIAAELQHYGGDTLVNLVRRTGVPYREILQDVCAHVGVKVASKLPASEAEPKLIVYLIEKVWAKLGPREQAGLSETLGVPSPDDLRRLLDGSTPNLKLAHKAASTMATALAGHYGRLLLGGAVARLGTPMVLPAALGGPITLALGALISLQAFSGPAYRVTIPCVVQIAYMRTWYASQKPF